MALRKCMGCMQDFDESLEVCPHCGYVVGTPKKEAYHLEPETILEGRYIIGKSIGAGGFGITYVAWDSVLEQKVAVKEYLPSEFATRMIDTTEVIAYDGEKTVQYQAGLESFVDEALRLAKLNHLEGIVHIYDSFISNSTAYIIMEYVEGETLMEMLKARGPLPYQEVIKIVVPVLNALDEVHKEGIIHRDIAPDNIKISGDKVTLLDFGAARNATTVHSKSLSVILKPGYAPEEQYRSHGNQGPWTDVYAMAAVIYHAITGKIPEESVERNVNDTLQSPTEIGFPLPVPIENAIMNALNVKAENRTQSAKQFADALSGAIVVERVVEEKKTVDTGSWTKKHSLITGISAAVLVLLVGVIALASPKVNLVSIEGKAMPELIGLQYDDVGASLRKVGLNEDNFQVVGNLDNVPDAQAGEVVDQSVQQGYKLTADDKDIVVELKMVKVEVQEENKEEDTAAVPDLRSLSKAEAKAALAKAGFNNYEFKTKKTNSFKEGLVCDQSPGANKKVKKTKKITVYIAKEKEPTTKKDTTTTKKNTTTKQETTKKETTEKKTTAKPKATKPKTTKHKTTAKQTTKKPSTTKKKVTTTKKVTEALVSVPGVAGMSGRTASSEIRGRGLSVNTVYITCHDESKDGIVSRQSPSSGSKVKKGTTVTIYVYNYKPAADDDEE